MVEMNAWKMKPSEEKKTKQCYQLREMEINAEAYREKNRKKRKLTGERNRKRKREGKR